MTTDNMDQKVRKLIKDAGGTPQPEPTTLLPDGSAFLTAEFPLPKDHWIYGNSTYPPMPMKMGTDDPNRKTMTAHITAAAQYAIKASTMNGQDNDFDPDAMVQNMIIGLLGYNTPTGLSSEPQFNPPETR